MSSEHEDMDSTQKIKRIDLSENKLIPVVCSWCKKIYKIAGWKILQGKQTGVSHGICPECLEKFEKEMKESSAKQKK